MNFSTKGKQAEAMPEYSGAGYLNPGINLVTINKIEFVASKSGEKEVATFHVEGKPIEGFEGKDRPDGTKALGPLGKVTYGIYNPVGDEKAIDELIASLAIIADVCGVREKVDAIQAKDLEQFLNKFVATINGKFFWCVIKGSKGDKGWFLDSFRPYFVGKKGDPDRKTYIIALPEKCVNIKSIKTEEEKGCIAYIEYENAEGKKGTLRWDKNNAYDLRESTTTAKTVTPDEELASDTSAGPISF